MKLLSDADKFNRELNNILIQFENKIPHMYKLSELYIDASNPIRKVKREFLFLRRLFGFFKSFLTMLFRSHSNNRSVSKIEGDILLVSPYINKVSKENFFFGDLDNHFRNLNKITVDLRIYNGESSEREYFTQEDDLSLNIFYLPCLNLRENFIVFKDLLRTFKDLSVVINKEEDLEKIKILKLIRNRIFSKTNFFNFYLATQIDNWIKKNNFRFAVVTFDGSPWERIFCNKFKALNERTKVAFYQHAPLTEKSYSLFNKYPKLMNPDRIFCTGKIPYKILSNNISFLKKISVLGSRKHQIEPMERSFDKEESVLFITQGLRKDILTLYRVAIRLAFHKKGIKAKVLIHPAANVGLLFRIVNKFFELFLSNFKCFSALDDNDFSKSKFMVYFSSSLAIEKIFFDVRPIHLESSSHSNPLKELVDSEHPALSWCRQAKNFNDILNIIDSKSDLDSIELGNSKENAKIFSKKYFEPFKLTKEIISD